ncbi:DoxX family protein [Mucilaginibacter sp. AK015]|uniref:DoxX family protein n=1 Tax=Mucilaginibacter sp. AK015 TaxID=2723072 RepID=UPI0016142F69|nr:DoxX family protein [Mucilaginibacter sp. AK015]MBB5394997.1 putative membrane protein YphA (DoxX/SURF4 family) [Mucilaginibacter sp. AK015]
MNVINKVETWGDKHHPAILDILRILLGIFLFLKGLTFMQNINYLRWIIEDQQVINLSPVFLKAVMYYVIFVHMTGGVLIALGLLTRLSSLLQLPIVISALFVINIFKSEPNNDLWLSIFACALLIIFAVIGSGPLSLNNLLTSKDENNAAQ